MSAQFRREGGWVSKRTLSSLRELTDLLDLTVREDLEDSVNPPISHFLNGFDKLKCIWKQATRETMALRPDHVGNNCTHYKCISWGGGWGGGGEQEKERKARGAGEDGAQKFEDLNMRGLNEC